MVDRGKRKKALKELKLIENIIRMVKGSHYLK